MIPLLTADEMRALERRAIDGGMPSLELQEAAAAGALELIPEGAPLHVLAGPGNNGGDALALARLARAGGRRVEVWALTPEPTWKGDAAIQARRWEEAGGTYRFTEDPEAAQSDFGGWVVDGLFGLGVRLPLPEAAQAWVTALAHREGRYRVLALDLPTGLDPSRAEAGDALAADVTACFGFRKICHGLRPARDLCGDLWMIELPVPEPEPALWLNQAPGFWWQGEWASHKRQHGHVVIRAGSLGMSGAAVLAALGALRMGAGLVTVLTDAEVRAEIAAQVPEAMVRVWQGQLPEDADVVLVGPGGVSEIPAWGGLLVLDASALRPGEGHRWMSRPRTVITPHAGEFARLFDLPKPEPEEADARLAQVRQVATGPGVLLLKGAPSLIAGGGEADVIANPSGHSGLATGGTGDLLAGMTAGWLARFKGWADHDPGFVRRQVAGAAWFQGAAADRLGPGPVLVRELAAAVADELRDHFKDWDGDWRPLSER
ncbi:MAG TPA: NAD(P)H-hydrate dehydratase [Holophagaceae bacterium]|nr:NAD(P)H-hydrate dehydratase [Holophagaceae bacterium]